MTLDTGERLIIPADRGKALTNLIVSLAGLILLIWLIKAVVWPAGHEIVAQSGWSWLLWLASAVLGGGGVLLGVLAVIHTWTLFRPPLLVLTDRSLEVRGPFGSLTIALKDIEAFEVRFDRQRRRSLVGWRCVGVAPNQRLNSVMDNSVGFGWPGSPTQLCARLETWRRRHSHV
ncbi:hypothetical protein [Brevundimonas sp.]|uniref:hypothetical protein n=1 Tax=Brevundimonas sp. TaxID=1871086 RepID=UPI0035B02F3C